jgi:hypothetical protein
MGRLLKVPIATFSTTTVQRHEPGLGLPRPHSSRRHRNNWF